MWDFLGEQSIVLSMTGEDETCHKSGIKHFLVNYNHLNLFDLHY